MTAKNATSGKLVEELYTLFYYYPPKQMARNLRKMFLDYAEGELSVGTPDYFNDLIPNLNWLFNFLDVAEEEFVISDNEEPTEFDNYLLFDNNAIKTTINFIVALIRPEKIYSIRYDVEIEAINNTNYDLILVIPDNSQKSFKEYETLIDIVCLNNNLVTFSLHQSATLAAQIQEGNLFYCKVCTEENLIYDIKPNNIFSCVSMKVEENRRKARVAFQKAFVRAPFFLEGANDFLAKGQKEIAAFMLHQAAELTLRAIIYALTGKEVRSHSLIELLKNCKRVAPKLYLILSSCSDEQISKIQNAYLGARYQENFSISVDQVRYMSNVIARLQEEALLQI